MERALKGLEIFRSRCNAVHFFDCAELERGEQKNIIPSLVKNKPLYARTRSGLCRQATKKGCRGTKYLKDGACVDVENTKPGKDHSKHILLEKGRKNNPNKMSENEKNQFKETTTLKEERCVVDSHNTDSNESTESTRSSTAGDISSSVFSNSKSSSCDLRTKKKNEEKKKKKEIKDIKGIDEKANLKVDTRKKIRLVCGSPSLKDVACSADFITTEELEKEDDDDDDDEEEEEEEEEGDEVEEEEDGEEEDNEVSDDDYEGYEGEDEKNDVDTDNACSSDGLMSKVFSGSSSCRLCDEEVENIINNAKCKLGNGEGKMEFQHKGADMHVTSGMEDCIESHDPPKIFGLADLQKQSLNESCSIKKLLEKKAVTTSSSLLVHTGNGNELSDVATSNQESLKVKRDAIDYLQSPLKSENIKQTDDKMVKETWLINNINTFIQNPLSSKEINLVSIDVSIQAILDSDANHSLERKMEVSEKSDLSSPESSSCSSLEFAGSAESDTKNDIDSHNFKLNPHANKTIDSSKSAECCKDCFDMQLGTLDSNKTREASKPTDLFLCESSSLTRNNKRLFVKSRHCPSVKKERFVKSRWSGNTTNNLSNSRLVCGKRHLRIKKMLSKHHVRNFNSNVDYKLGGLTEKEKQSKDSPPCPLKFWKIPKENDANLKPALKSEETLENPSISGLSVNKACRRELNQEQLKAKTGVSPKLSCSVSKNRHNSPMASSFGIKTASPNWNGDNKQTFRRSASKKYRHVQTPAFNYRIKDKINTRSSDHHPFRKATTLRAALSDVPNIPQSFAERREFIKQFSSSIREMNKGKRRRKSIESCHNVSCNKTTSNQKQNPFSGYSSLSYFPAFATGNSNVHVRENVGAEPIVTLTSASKIVPTVKELTQFSDNTSIK